jgi:hypothetical protein
MISASRPRVTQRLRESAPHSKPEADPAGTISGYEKSRLWAGIGRARAHTRLRVNVN